MIIKSRTRTLLQEAGCEATEWPLATKLAAHAMRSRARRALTMKLAPSLPYNSRVQILQKSWDRGVWESVTTTTRTKGPSSDSSRGWIVKTCEGQLLTTGTFSPAPREDQQLECTCPGEPVPVSEPKRRIRGGNTLKAFAQIHELSVTTTLSQAEHLARGIVSELDDSVESAKSLIDLAACTFPVSARDGTIRSAGALNGSQSWCDNLGEYGHQGAVGTTNLRSSHPWLSCAVASWAS